MQRRGATRLESLSKRKADFIEPMDCAPVTKLLDGPGWIYEIKLDGYRAVAVKSDRGVNLFRCGAATGSPMKRFLLKRESGRRRLSFWER